MRLGSVLFVSLLLVLPLHGSEAKTVAGPASTSPTVLIIGGLAGDDESVRLVENEVRYFEGIRQDHRNFTLIAIPRRILTRSRFSFLHPGLLTKQTRFPMFSGAGSEFMLPILYYSLAMKRAASLRRCPETPLLESAAFPHAA